MKDAHAVDVLKKWRADILVVMIMVTVCNDCETFAVQGASVCCKLQILPKHTWYIVYVLQSSQWHDLYNNGKGDYNYLEKNLVTRVVEATWDEVGKVNKRLGIVAPEI